MFVQWMKRLTIANSIMGASPFVVAFGMGGASTSTLSEPNRRRLPPNRRQLPSNRRSSSTHSTSESEEIRQAPLGNEHTKAGGSRLTGVCRRGTPHFSL